VAEGLGQHISKGYIYFAMAFSVFVEVLNLRIRAKSEAPVQLHDGYHGSPVNAPEVGIATQEASEV
jgi:hypothetical protein